MRGRMWLTGYLATALLVAAVAFVVIGASDLAAAVVGAAVGLVVGRAGPRAE